MSYGQGIFRIKYKETMDSLNIIKNNYYDLDSQYQEEMKEKDDEIERLKEEIKGYEQERERVLNIIDERNNKAIKYLKSKEWAIDYEKSSCRTHLLEILKGENDE